MNHPTGEPGLGDRLAAIRKRRGLSQLELARRSGIGYATVQAIEQDRGAQPRIATLLKLARALRVPTTRIINGGDDREEEDPGTAAEWEPVTRALAGAAGQPDEDPTPGSVLAAIAEIRPVIAQNRFSAARPLLAAAIRDADALDDGPDARDARFRALNMAGWVLTQMRQWDTATFTLDQAADAAPTALDAASVVKTRIWLLLRQGALAAARDAASAAADDIEPRFSRATPAELSLWGHLQLNIANAAVRDNRSGDAQEALRLAGAAASLIGREIMSDPSTTRVFGPATVAYCRAETAVLDEKPDLTLAIDERVPANAFPAADMTRLRHRLDVANALTQLRRYGEAVAVISDIRQSAPEWLPRQRYARDVLGRIVDRRRTLTPEIRELADAVQLPL